MTRRTVRVSLFLAAVGTVGGALLVRDPALGIAAAGLLILFVGAMLVRE